MTATAIETLQWFEKPAALDFDFNERQAASYLGVTVQQFRQYARDYGLPFLCLPHSKPRYRKTDLNAFLAVHIKP